jgi:hypothetical protein
LQIRKPHPPRTPLRILPPAGPAVQPEVLSRAAYAAMLIAAIGIGVLVRATIVLSSDFPLNDGGMFFAMVRDIQASHYALPAFTTYNSSDIPFAYPPLGLYLAGFIDDATPVSLLTVFRFLPMIVSSLTLVAFFAFARRILESRAAVVAAVFVFGLLPATFQWMIMGGGLTRSFGFLFAILALGQIHAMYTGRSLPRVPLVTLLASLVVLSHIEMAWLTAFVSVLLFAAYGRSRTGVLASVAVAAGTLLLTSPWWATVLHQHGTGPMLAAFESGAHPVGGLFLLVQFDLSFDPLFNVIAALALLGLVASLARRQYLLSCWLVSAALLDARTFPISSAIPLAMLAVIGLHDVVLPAATHPGGLGSLRRSQADGPSMSDPSPPRWLGGSVATVVVCYVILSAFMATPKLLTGITRDERDAMHWVAANTPPDSRFAVVSADGWSVDRTSEWFPVLAGRKSVATVQGTEWLAGGRFTRQQGDFLALQKCANLPSACLDHWAAQTNTPFDYVYITKIPPRAERQSNDVCCAVLRAALSTDPRYSLAYDNSAAIIFQRRP